MRAFASFFSFLSFVFFWHRLAIQKIGYLWVTLGLKVNLQHLFLYSPEILSPLFDRRVAFDGLLLLLLLPMLQRLLQLLMHLLMKNYYLTLWWELGYIL